MEKLIDFALVLRLKCRLFLMRESQSKLSKLKYDQKNAYFKLRNDFSKKYSLSGKNNYGKFITSMWEKHNNQLKKTLLPFPKFSFLQDPIIMKSMFATGKEQWLTDALSDIEKMIPRNRLIYLLREEYVGVPLIINRAYLASPNNVVHMYHLANFIKNTGCDIGKINTIIEWGGGYGNLTKLFVKLRKRPYPTYIMIDTPLISCLQWLYLSIVLGDSMVYYVKSAKDSIRKNKINIVSLPFLGVIKNKPNLFISTWALSESSKFSQDFVINKGWLKAPHLLIGYRESDERLPDSDRVGRIAEENGAKIIPIKSIPGKQFYAFK